MAHSSGRNCFQHIDVSKVCLQEVVVAAGWQERSMTLWKRVYLLWKTGVRKVTSVLLTGLAPHTQILVPTQPLPPPIVSVCECRDWQRCLPLLRDGFLFCVCVCTWTDACLFLCATNAGCSDETWLPCLRQSLVCLKQQTIGVLAFVRRYIEFRKPHSRTVSQSLDPSAICIFCVHSPNFFNNTMQAPTAR